MQNAWFFGIGAIAGLGALMNTWHLYKRVDRLERELAQYINKRVGKVESDVRAMGHGGPPSTEARVPPAA